MNVILFQENFGEEMRNCVYTSSYSVWVLVHELTWLIKVWPNSPLSDIAILLREAYYLLLIRSLKNI